MILFGVFDARPMQVLEALAEEPKSFTEVLNKTSLPKATLHRNLAGLAKNKFVKKAEDLYMITSDGEFLLKFFKHLRARGRLKITDDALRRVLKQASRTLRAELAGFSRAEQFENIQEAVESVEVVGVFA